MTLEDGRSATLPSHYLEDGHVTHAYAITGHKAQGMTTEKAFVLGDETLYREWGYVAMSRGKQNNSLYVVAGQDPEREELGGQIEAAPDPLGELTRALGRSRAKDLAMDVYEQEGIRRMSFPELRTAWEEDRQLVDRMPPEVQGQPDQLLADSERLSELLERLSERETELRDARGAAKKLRGRLARSETRVLESDLKDVLERRSKTEEDLRDVQRRREELREAEADRDAWLLENAPSVRRLDALGRELWWREQQQAIAAEVAMPQYLIRAVGERPLKPSERSAWHESVKAVESYRARWGVTDEERALGDRDSVSGRQALDGAATQQRLERVTEVPVEREVEIEPVDRSLEL
jgi:chaperonin cofactor prefoldin